VPSFLVPTVFFFERALQNFAEPSILGRFY
jgi:hypothetical protein